MTTNNKRLIEKNNSLKKEKKIHNYIPIFILTHLCAQV
jgi:hypothetical protein